ncbi:MAG: S26 family signal peptidase, partial [Actinomycetota bacterium]
YFVMGDNRANSSDSRSTLGPIRRSEIVGRAFIRVWPLRRLRLLRRPDYAAAAGGILVLAGLLSRRRRRSASPA